MREGKKGTERREQEKEWNNYIEGKTACWQWLSGGAEIMGHLLCLYNCLPFLYFYILGSFKCFHHLKVTWFISRAPLVAQMVTSLPEMQETWVQSLGWEDPLAKGMATHSSILAWRIPWTAGPGVLQSRGCQSLKTLYTSFPVYSDSGLWGWHSQHFDLIVYTMQVKIRKD